MVLAGGFVRVLFVGALWGFVWVRAGGMYGYIVGWSTMLMEGG